MNESKSIFLLFKTLTRKVEHINQYETPFTTSAKTENVLMAFIRQGCERH